MNNFTSQFNKSQDWKILDTKKVNLKWDKDLKDIFIYGKNESKALVDMIKERVQSSLKEYYKEFPRKLLAQSVGSVTVKICIRNKSKIFEEIEELYDLIGMSAAISSMNNIVIATYNIMGSTRSKSHVEDINKIDWGKSSKYEPSSKTMTELPGNGYNSLPGKTITIYRDKLIETIDKFEVTTQINEHTNKCMMCISPIFNDAKLKKLMKEIQNNDELKEYARKLNSTNKAISKYYSEKKSGDYTGD